VDAPHIFMRPCDKCKKYFYYEGKIQLGPDNKPIERAAGQVPNCRLCEKFDEETGEIWEKFSDKNQMIFEIFLACRHFHQLPYEGGVVDQDPWLMEVLVRLGEIFNRGEACKNKEFQLDMAKAMLGARI
jgi:hypothetical protein